MARLEQLEGRIGQGDEDAWAPFLAALQTLAVVAERVNPGQRGELLTTGEMAARLGLAPKTLLRHVAGGSVKPAVWKGKLIRWKGDEVPR